jgi:hypothetical protein
MKQRSKHIIKKQLDRELKHVHWLEKNLKSTALLKSSKKQVLKLYTELKVGNSK